jgi:hypothetical protein
VLGRHLRFGRVGDLRALDHLLDGIAQVREAEFVFGRERHRLAQAEREALHAAGLAVPALALVGDQHHRRGPAPQPVGEMAIERRQPGAGVDQQQRQIGGFDGALGLIAHARLEARRLGLLEPGGIDHREAQVEQPRLALAPVAGHARLLGDQRQALADQAIEQRRLADVGTADDGDGEAHAGSVSLAPRDAKAGLAGPEAQRRATRVPPSVRKYRLLSATTGARNTLSGSSMTPRTSPL